MTGAVKLIDCAACGYCVSGVKIKMAGAGIDFRQLATTGIPFEVWDTYDDAQFHRCREAANRRLEQEVAVDG